MGWREFRRNFIRFELCQGGGLLLAGLFIATPAAQIVVLLVYFIYLPTTFFMLLGPVSRNNLPTQLLYSVLAGTLLYSAIGALIVGLRSERKQRDLTKCPQCGYDCQASTSCPECGLAQQPKEQA